MLTNTISRSSLIIDGLVLIVYFFGIVGIGLWAGRKNRNLTDFTLGSRSIPWWVVLASIIAAETSAATFLGTPAEGFKTRSFVYAQLTIGTILARIVIAFTFIRPYYRYGVQSIYEFLDIRFGPWTKNLASGIFLFTRVLGIGVRLYLGGVIIKVVWHYLFPGTVINLSVYFVGILFVTIVTALYTAIGGIKAVVWTDFIQATLMVSSMVFAIWLLLHRIPGGIASHLNGFPQIFQVGWNSTETFGTAFKQMLEEPYTIFSAIIAQTFYTMATHGTDQDNVQRMLTASDFRKSRLSLILSGFADIPIAFGFLLVGILLATYYQLSPDPQMPAADNEIFAYYIVTQMPVGMRGLIIAGIFATMMGSTSAALNALATSFTKDFCVPYFLQGRSEKLKVLVARMSTVIFGGLMIIVATLAASAVLHDSKLTIIPLALQSFGYAYGSLLAVFLLGILTRTRGSDRMNVVGMGLGIVAVLTLSRVRVPAINLHFLLFSGKLVPQDWTFGGWLPEWWPAISFPWWVMLGCLVCFSFSVTFATPIERIKTVRERNLASSEPRLLGGQEKLS